MSPLVSHEISSSTKEANPPSRLWLDQDSDSSVEQRPAEGPAPARHRLPPAGLQIPTRSDAESSDGEESVRPVRPAGPLGASSLPPSIEVAPMTPGVDYTHGANDYSLNVDYS